MIIISLIFITSIYLVIRLTYKNSTLKYLSDDSRQIELLKELSTSIIQDKIEDENIKVEFDSGFFLNFVNNTAFVTSQKETLYSSILEHSKENKEANVYTISSSFNIKKLLLTIVVSGPKEKEQHTNYETTFKLSKGKNNTIKFKEKEFKKQILDY